MRPCNAVIDSGWEVGAAFDAAARASDKDGVTGGEILLDAGAIYSMTANGRALQTTIKGSRYCKDTGLN